MNEIVNAARGYHVTQDLHRIPFARNIRIGKLLSLTDFFCMTLFSDIGFPSIASARHHGIDYFGGLFHIRKVDATPAEEKQSTIFLMLANE